jgi:hypothetical protein
MRYGLILLAGVLLGKLILWIVDPNIRLFMGDSGSYLHTALTGFIPPDRSFTYGYVIRFTAVSIHSLAGLVLFQSFLGALLAFGVWWTLTRVFDAPPVPAIVCAVLLAIEPAQLYYERTVLAECIGLFFLASFTIANLWYVRTGNLWFLPVAAVAGILTVSLRFNFLPVVLVVSVASPVIRAVGDLRANHPGSRFRWGTWIPTAGAIALLLAMHLGYQSLYGHLRDAPAAYHGKMGLMRMVLVAPLLEPRHFAEVGVDPVFLEQLCCSLENPGNRAEHMWQREGLVKTLSRTVGGRLEADQLASRIATRALLESPLDFILLGLDTTADYFRSRVAEQMMYTDLGRRKAPSAELIARIDEHFGWNASQTHLLRSPVISYFSGSRWWLAFCLVGVPVLAVVNLLVAWRRTTFGCVLVVTLVTLGVHASTVFLFPISSYRYLHALPFLLILNTGVLMAAVAARGRSGGDPGRPVSDLPDSAIHA